VAFWDPPVPGGNPVAEQRLNVLYREILRLETKAAEIKEPIQMGPYSKDNNPFPLN